MLLGAAVIVQLRTPGGQLSHPFYFLVGLTYAVSLGFIASLKMVERWPWLTDVHFGIDAVVVSAAVFITGGVESLFVILYMCRSSRRARCVRRADCSSPPQPIPLFRCRRRAVATVTVLDLPFTDSSRPICLR